MRRSLGSERTISGLRPPVRPACRSTEARIASSIMNDSLPSNMLRPYSSDDEITAYRSLEQDLRSSPIGPGVLLQNLGLFLTRASLARILFMHDLYLKIINVPGCAMEFGCQFGQSLALFTSFRTIYEPQNVGRKIIGFDTFEGYT